MKKIKISSGLLSKRHNDNTKNSGKVIKSYIIPFEIDQKGQVNILVGVIKEKTKKTLKKQPYTYSFLGGTCEKNESPDKCLIRELFEESTGFLCLSLEDLNPENILKFKIPFNDGSSSTLSHPDLVQMYVVQIPQLDKIVRSVNYHYGQNKPFKPEYLEYHFLKQVPLKKLLEISEVFPNTYPHTWDKDQIDKIKCWNKYAREFYELGKDKRKEGIWYLSRSALERMIRTTKSDCFD